MSRYPDDRRGGGSVTFLGLLTIVFIALKLAGEIDWSWWWVLSPIWLTGLLIFAMVGIGAFLVKR